MREGEIGKSGGRRKRKKMEEWQREGRREGRMGRESMFMKKNRKG